MDGLKYPWCYLHKHPILAVIIAWNYRQRRLRKLPDKWHWADIKLMDKVYSPIADNMRKYPDRQ